MWDWDFISWIFYCNYIYLKDLSVKHRKVKLVSLLKIIYYFKGGSVEGKGGQLNQLDPNRMAAVKEHTERTFLGEDSLKWVEIKRGIDEKCRMVRNNRCFVWGGVNMMKKD